MEFLNDRGGRRIKSAIEFEFLLYYARRLERKGNWKLAS